MPEHWLIWAIVLLAVLFDYINGFRLEKAKGILEDPAFDGCIEEVALLSGFNSVSTFRRSFQKRYGCSPSQYRKGEVGK